MPGRVVAVAPDAVSGTVKVDIGVGVLVTASIAQEAIAELGLAEATRSP